MNLLQPVNPWLGSEWQIYNGAFPPSFNAPHARISPTPHPPPSTTHTHTHTHARAEYYQWVPSHNQNSQSHTVTPGMEL